MKFDLFLNFNGECREAAEFYARAFQRDIPEMMTYGQAPGMETAEADKDRVMYASLPVGGVNMMLMDFSSDMKCVTGNNINPALGVDNREEVLRLYDALREGGSVHTEPQPTFWSEYYCAVEDKYGVLWHISYYNAENAG